MAPAILRRDAFAVVFRFCFLCFDWFDCLDRVNRFDRTGIAKGKVSPILRGDILSNNEVRHQNPVKVMFASYTWAYAIGIVRVRIIKQMPIVMDLEIISQRLVLLLLQFDEVFDKVYD